MKNPVLAKAIQHFKNRSDAEMQEIHVKEWDTTVY